MQKFKKSAHLVDSEFVTANNIGRTLISVIRQPSALMLMSCLMNQKQEEEGRRRGGGERRGELGR